MVRRPSATLIRHFTEPLGKVDLIGLEDLLQAFNDRKIYYKPSRDLLENSYGFFYAYNTLYSPSMARKPCTRFLGPKPFNNSTAALRAFVGIIWRPSKEFL